MVVHFTRDVSEAIFTIAHELKRANDLKEKELYLKYGYEVKKYGRI